MITKKELIEIARKSDLGLYHQEKDYLLKLFLYLYYKRFEDAIFKGGTAIKFIKGLNRFSEDLDFNISISPKGFQEQVEHILKEIKAIGIENSFIKNELFSEAFTCEIAFYGPLYDGSAQTRNKFRIDAGKRIGTLAKPVWNIIESEYPETKERFAVKAMDIREILCEKIISLFHRNKGRDLYDVWFLFNSGVVLDLSLLKRKLSDAQLNEKDFTTKAEYERDLKYLVPRVIPYEQVKAEALGFMKEIKL